MRVIKTKIHANPQLAWEHWPACGNELVILNLTSLPAYHRTPARTMNAANWKTWTHEFVHKTATVSAVGLSVVVMIFGVFLIGSSNKKKVQYLEFFILCIEEIAIISPVTL